ncbi:hypothetical protein LCGC14_0488850 [marine sediment metagenome]|uniref:Uncharacterized protein n=1 Tax=marine sediment metagenome TaxID=412755 RepID=A0A0F9VG14_9ZZZZ
MPDGKLSPQEFRLFESYVRRTKPVFGAFQVPANREGIRETSLYKQWIREEPFSRLSPTALATLEKFGLQAPKGVVVGEETPREIAERAATARAEAEGVSLAPEGAAGVEVPTFPTEPPPQGFRWAFDRDLNRWVPQFAGLTAQQQAQQQASQRQAMAEIDILNRRLEFEQQQALPQRITPFQQQQFDIQQQQIAQGQQQFQAQLGFQQQQAAAQQATQQRQFASQLAANPINWLQYASFTGQPPVVQPWMVPLGQNIEGLQVGQPIPGFQGGQTGQQEIQSFAGLPQLTTPSAQLQARWGPTAQAQFLGFRQARTGATPQETQFRLGSQRAPAGAFGGFSRFRTA